MAKTSKAPRASFNRHYERAEAAVLGAYMDDTGMTVEQVRAETGHSSGAISGWLRNNDMPKHMETIVKLWKKRDALSAAPGRRMNILVSGSQAKCATVKDLAAQLGLDVVTMKMA